MQPLALSPFAPTSYGMDKAAFDAVAGTADIFSMSVERASYRYVVSPLHQDISRYGSRPTQIMLSEVWSGRKMSKGGVPVSPSTISISPMPKTYTGRLYRPSTGFQVEDHPHAHRNGFMGTSCTARFSRNVSLVDHHDLERIQGKAELQRRRVCQQGAEFEKLIDLPRQVGVPLKVAVGG
jgi:hypothetical protein